MNKMVKGVVMIALSACIGLASPFFTAKVEMNSDTFFQLNHNIEINLMRRSGNLMTSSTFFLNSCKYEYNFFKI